MSTDEATAFYDALAPMFDVMTDWQARLAGEGPFLRAILEDAGARRVLDAACGSGGHALALAEWGYTAAGADASPVMVALAQKKATLAGLDLPFSVAGLDELPGRAGTERAYDAVLCLGNSLPHLLSQQALVDALRGMAGVLRPGGLLITQNLNYDLRWQKRPRFFGAQGGQLEGQNVLVWRFADYDQPPGQIAFHIALFRQVSAAAQGDWQVEVHTTPQRPLFEADLAAGLREAGFRITGRYGQMAWPAPAYAPEGSGDLVVVAELA